MPNPQSPPKIAYWLLRIFCRPDYCDEVAGDLQEIYEWRLSTGKTRSARFRYYLDTFSAIRFYRGGRLTTFIASAMLFSFIKSSLRNFKTPYWLYFPECFRASFWPNRCSVYSGVRFRGAQLQ